MLKVLRNIAIIKGDSNATVCMVILETVRSERGTEVEAKLRNIESLPTWRKS